MPETLYICKHNPMQMLYFSSSRSSSLFVDLFEHNKRTVYHAAAKKMCEKSHQYNTDRYKQTHIPMPQQTPIEGIIRSPLMLRSIVHMQTFEGERERKKTFVNTIAISDAYRPIRFKANKIFYFYCGIAFGLFNTHTHTQRV